MGLWDWVILLVVAGVCGGVARALAGGTRGGCLVSVALGFVGALIGLWLQRLTGAPEVVTLDFGETKFPIVWSIIGAALFVAALGLLSGGRRDG